MNQNSNSHHVLLVCENGDKFDRRKAIHPSSFILHPFRRKTGQSGFSLVEILVVALVIALLAGGLMALYVGKSGKPHEKSHGPIAQSQSVVCMNNLRQIRMAIDMAHQSDPDGKFPESLAELKLPNEMLACPDGHEPYVYDPTTGQVHCVHPGHETF